MKSVVNIHWKNWCWSWNSNTLATWYEKLTYLKRHWCWEGLKPWGGDDRGWGGITHSMAMSLNKLQELVMDREAWHTAVCGITESGMNEWLSTHTHMGFRECPGWWRAILQLNGPNNIILKNSWKIQFTKASPKGYIHRKSE